MGLTSNDLTKFIQQLQLREGVHSRILRQFLQKLYESVLQSAWEDPQYSFSPQGPEEFVSHPLREFEENVVPRRRTQRKLSTKTIKNTIAIDAGYLGTEGFTERDGIVSLAAIHIQEAEKITPSRRTILFPPDFRSRHLLLMGATEVNAAACLASWGTRGEAICSDFELETHGLNEELCMHQTFPSLKGQGEVIVSLDRPLFPYHLWGGKGKSKLPLVEAYERFYKVVQRTGALAYSVISSSMQKSIIEVIAEAINGEGSIKNARPLLSFLEHWVNENEQLALEMLERLIGLSSSNLAEWVKTIGDESIARLFFGMLAEKLDDGSPYLKDYDVFNTTKFKFEDRSTTWTLNAPYTIKGSPEAYVARMAGALDLSFFYVSYGKMYSRVEFTGNNPTSVYHHYLLMTSRTKRYYPFHLELAHEHAVMKGRVKRGFLSLLLTHNLGVPGPKLLSKIGGTQSGAVLESF